MLFVITNSYLFVGIKAGDEGRTVVDRRDLGFNLPATRRLLRYLRAGRGANSLGQSIESRKTFDRITNRRYSRDFTFEVVFSPERDA